MRRSRNRAKRSRHHKPRPRDALHSVLTASLGTAPGTLARHQTIIFVHTAESTGLLANTQGLVVFPWALMTLEQVRNHSMFT